MRAMAIMTRWRNPRAGGKGSVPELGLQNHESSISSRRRRAPSPRGRVDPQGSPTWFPSLHRIRDVMGS